MVNVHLLVGMTGDSSSFIMQGIKALLQMSFRLDASPDSPRHLQIIDRIPTDIRTILNRFNLTPRSIIYTTCPRCSKLYDSNNYPDECNFYDVDGVNCGASLSRQSVAGLVSIRRPIRRFAYQHVGAWLGRFLSRADIETLVDNPTNTFELETSDGVCRNMWCADFLREFTWRDGKGAADIPTGEGRLIFGMGTDYFNPYGNREAKKKWSVGAMFLVCLNLPMHLRYQIENVCLVGIIPGPREPSMEEVNHFLRPLIDELLPMWEDGVWLSSTANYPTGKKVYASLGPLVVDVVAARQAAGFSSHSSHLFCSFCLLPKSLIDNFDKATWSKYPRTVEEHRVQAQRWKDAKSSEERIAITDEFGVRYSEFLRLYYWNPIKRTMLDPMHLWLNLAIKHFREIWGMDATIEAGEGTFDQPRQPLSDAEKISAQQTYDFGTKTALKNLKIHQVEFLALSHNIRTGGRAKNLLIADIQAQVSSSLIT